MRTRSTVSLSTLIESEGNTIHEDPEYRLEEIRVRVCSTAAQLNLN